MAYRLDNETISAGQHAIMAGSRPRHSPALTTIVYGGRRFATSREMAELFLRHAREVIESGEPQLVPLRHVGGIEFVLMSRRTPYSLGDPDSDDD